MIISAVITQCRRQYQDIPKSSVMAQNGDGTAKLFNVGKFPIIENSYSIYMNNLLQASSGYTLDLDNGDLVKVSAVPVGEEIRSEHKYAFWRDQNWVDAINEGIEALNGRGFFRQIVRDTSVFAISANVQTYSGPAGAVDVYEILQSSNNTISGTFSKPMSNWSWQQDAQKIVFGQKPTVAAKAMCSYLRELKTYTATSATIDVTSAWVEIVKKKAGAVFYRNLAGKIAKQGNATIDEGHFSFTNLRTMANDLDQEFDLFAKHKKPTRPAKDIQWNLASGGPA